MNKNDFWYAIESPDGEVFPWYCTYRPENAINKFLISMHTSTEWNKFQEKGYKCIKISINKEKNNDR